MVINTSAAGKVGVSLYSFLGQDIINREVMFNEPGSHTVTLDVSHLSPGIYFYTVSLGAQTAGGKLVVE